MLTRDKKNLEVAWYVSWRIADVERFLRTVRTVPDAQSAAGRHGGVGAGGRAGRSRSGRLVTVSDQSALDAMMTDVTGAWPSRPRGSMVWRSSPCGCGG